MKVYVITCGEYSDYGIAYVTLNREDAYKYVALRNRHNAYYEYEYRVEEFDTDHFPSLNRDDIEKELKDYVEGYVVRIDPQTNRLVSETGITKEFFPKSENGKITYEWAREIAVFVIADNEEKATKIAFDNYYMHKAELLDALY